MAYGFKYHCQNIFVTNTGQKSVKDVCLPAEWNKHLSGQWKKRKPLRFRLCRTEWKIYLCIQNPVKF